MPWQLGEQYNNETTETEITPEKDLFSVCKAHWQRCPHLLAKKMQIHWECVNTYNYGDISCKDAYHTYLSFFSKHFQWNPGFQIYDWVFNRTRKAISLKSKDWIKGNGSENNFLE